MFLLRLYLTLCFQLSPLLHLWSREIKEPEPGEPRPSAQAANGAAPVLKSELKSEQAFNPSSIEAVGLVFLCSPFAFIRYVSACDFWLKLALDAF